MKKGMKAINSIQFNDVNEIKRYETPFVYETVSVNNMASHYSYYGFPSCNHLS